jgi:hypothetical protein
VPTPTAESPTKLERLRQQQQPVTVRIVVRLDLANLERNNFLFSELVGSDRASSTPPSPQETVQGCEGWAGGGGGGSGGARTNEDEYDLGDDFIDDAVGEDLSEDRVVTKHSGFYINAGALELVQPPSSTSASVKRGCVLTVVHLHSRFQRA